MKKLKFIRIIVLLQINIAYCLPNINSITENFDPIGQYEKFELTINLNASYTNPYNPDPATNGIDLWAIFTSPSGVTKRVNGFFMDTNNDGVGDSWKIRFSTGEIGTWNYVIYAKDNSGQNNSPLNTFQVVISNKKGFIRKSQKNPRYFVYENGGSFWGIGHNNGWQYSDINCPTCINNPNMSVMKNYGENLLSFWINTPWRTPFDEPARTPIENSAQGLLNYNQYSAKFVDDLIYNAEQYDIKLILQIWTHDNLRNGGCLGWSQGNWLNLAYSSLGLARDFFDDPNSLNYQYKYLRYIIARWSYSRAVFLWDLLVEANGTDGWCLDGPSVVENWLLNMKNFFKENDPFSHPITASLCGGWDSWNSDHKWINGWNITGISQMHSYEWKNDIAKVPRVIANNTIYMWNTFNQPNYIGEFGTSISSNQPTNLHRAAWAGVCSGASLEPLLWCDNGSYINMTEPMLQQQYFLSKFVNDIDFENKITEHKSVTVTGYYAWAVGSSDYAICWIFNDIGNISTGKKLYISNFLDNIYDVEWFNTWTGNLITKTAASSISGKITVDIPAVTYNDIACKIYNKSNMPTQTPIISNTFTPTITNTPYFTPTSTPQQSLSKAKVYPSFIDFKSKRTGVYFKNLTPNTLIQIFNLAGELIFQTVSKSESGIYYWDLQEIKKDKLYYSQRYPISSGVYIYILDNKREVKYGKIAIIK